VAAAVDDRSSMSDDVRDRSVEALTRDEAIERTLGWAHDRGFKTFYIRQISEGAWRARELPLPYYNSTEVQVRIVIAGPQPFRARTSPL
jgi:hypothetical protein